MPHVIIKKLNNDGSQSVLATCTLVDNQLKIIGDQTFIENLKTEGIRSYTQDQGKILFPQDGLPFLEQLKYNFKSGYLMASDVMPDKDPQ